MSRSSFTPAPFYKMSSAFSRVMDSTPIALKRVFFLYKLHFERRYRLAVNPGKEFEQQFKKSVEDDGYYYCRLNDPAASFNPNDSLRFSPQNPYDCFMFAYTNLICIELKSTQGTSMTFYREDFESDGNKNTYMIKKHQRDGLLKASKHNGIFAGLVLNWRKTSHTYFLYIDDFMNMTSGLDKKSFNENDVITNNGLIIEQTLKKVKYKYNIRKLVEELQNKYNLGDLINGSN